MNCQKHIIACHCILPQFRNNPQQIYHKFVVFSIIDEGDSVIPKHAKCNNCGIIHNVVDIGRSEILIGQEEGAVITKEDISLMVPISLKNILDNYDCDISTWEHAQFILQNSKYPSELILTRTEESGIVSGKILVFEEAGKFQIKPYSMKLII